MADIVAVVAGLAALVLGGLLFKSKRDARKTRDLLSEVIHKSVTGLAEKAEEDVAEKSALSSRPVKADIKALESARRKVDGMINPIPDDIMEIARRSAERVRKGE